MLCSNCSNDFSDKMARCPFCGQANLIENHILNCPDCNILLSNFNLGNQTMKICEKGCGFFVKKADQLELSDIKNLSQKFSMNDNLTEKNYQQCASCKALMKNFEFRHVSKIRFRNCLKHGTWVKFHQLPSLIQFLETGGVEKEKIFLEIIEKEKQHAKNNLSWSPESNSDFFNSTDSDSSWD